MENDNPIGELLSQVRESIGMVQSLELNDHVPAYDQIHESLERAMRSLDGI